MTDSENPYNIPQGIVFSFPVTVEGGRVSIVQDIAMPDPFSKDMIMKTTEELLRERDTVYNMLPK